MGKERIKTIIILVLSGVVILFIGVFLGMYLNKDKTPQNNVEKAKELSTEEVLASIVGEWGMCNGEYDCQGIFIGKDNNEYYYTPYIMWSEGGDRGTIKKIDSLGGNKYKLTVYYAGYEDDFGSSPERTIEYTIGTSEVAINNLYVGNKKYQLIKGDREIFFKSIMS